jgi:hypothetical protein
VCRDTASVMRGLSDRDDGSWLAGFMADGLRTIITWREDMGLVSGVLGFMVFLRSVAEVTLILVFGYIIPVMETLATVRIHPGGHPMADIKIDSLMGMWTGIVCLEAILIPVSSVLSSFL